MLFKKITMGQELVSWVGTLGTYLYFFYLALLIDKYELKIKIFNEFDSKFLQKNNRAADLIRLLFFMLGNSSIKYYYSGAIT